jgi:hypothetical protein
MEYGLIQNSLKVLVTFSQRINIILLTPGVLQLGMSFGKKKEKDVY